MVSAGLALLSAAGALVGFAAAGVAAWGGGMKSGPFWPHPANIDAETSKAMADHALQRDMRPPTMDWFVIVVAL